MSQGKIELQKERVDLNVLLRQAVEVSRPLIVEKRHELSLTLAPQAICWRRIRTRLVQVFANLINNAAKYTDAGGHIAIVSARRERRGGGHGARRRRRDDARSCWRGPSICSCRETRSLDRAQGGLGVGLTLVRTLVKMHGGSVRAFSEGPGRGQRARGEAAARDRRQSGPRTAQRRRRPRGRPARSASWSSTTTSTPRRALGQLLRLLGHEVTVAHDGPGALAAAAAPHRRTWCCSTSGCRGWTVTRSRRSCAPRATTRAALVAVTGYGREEDRRRSRDAGFDRHLVKPVDLAQLQQDLRRGPRAVTSAIDGVSRRLTLAR